MSLRTPNLRRLKLVSMHVDLLSHIQHTCESVGAAEDAASSDLTDKL